MTTPTRERLNDLQNDLRDLGRRVRHDAKDRSRRMWLAGLGLVGTLDERGRAVFQDLVERGEKADRTDEAVDSVRKAVRERGDRLEARVRELGDEMGRNVEENMTEVLHRFGVPARRDVEELIERVEKLTHKVENLSAA